MGFYDSVRISSTGLTAERTRMDIISKNIANINTTRTASGGPYRRQIAIFREQDAPTFEQALNSAKGLSSSGSGVEVAAIVDDKSEFKREYNPSHPDADEEGYVLLPNIDSITEMINLISANRAYDANVTVINGTKAMAMKALEIGK